MPAVHTFADRDRARPGTHARFESPEFGDLLYEQTRKTPWVLASLGVHAFGVLALLLLPTGSDVAGERPTALRMTPVEEPAPELDEPDMPEDPVKPDSLDPDKQDETYVPDPIPEVDPGAPVDADYVGSPGEPDNLGAVDFNAKGANSIIGLGSGLAGLRGNGGGNGKGGGGTGRGGPPAEDAVQRGLEWLRFHQAPNGSWEAEHFSEQCKLNRCDGHGESVYTPGVTGLATLAFLGHGETHLSGPFRQNVKRALRYMSGSQDAEGCFGPRTSPHYMYNHACASLAMAEAYGMTGSRLFKESAQRGVNFVHQAQNPYLAWRYGIRDGDNDTSVTGWMTMVLKSASMSGLDVDKGAFKGATAFIDKMTEPEFGRTGYQNRGGQSSRTTEMMDRFPADQTESLTAVALTARIFAGQDPATNESIQKGVDLLRKKLPRWDPDAGTIDQYYWYYGTLAMFQVGGKPWKEWEGAMKTAIIDTQRLEKGRDEYGSWDPEGPWAPEGGRVYSTALMTMCLEVYYRYPVVTTR